ncbi:nucleotidyltransferase domain-containing protein [Fictibacillus sp. 5RED26]|uniref:type VII toxin-antitoxin system MntA family adenylyltransferase antitoxin n=1 Tax=unclassified Fictibacillus TaxID=2644029 RepID=UPI0018CD5D38|nr:nucleotidyltransferase domain-containing protein [Fictibacillus sp. 5RED26]MBH0175730.1 nucleotidyltransferase domain-containing protein [Fictibacillus sp. 23RED33]
MVERKIEQQVITFLREKLDPYLIVVFGSTAKGTERVDSDLDLAYLSNHKLEKYDRFMVSQELAALVNKDVDLVDLNQVSTVFAAQIIQSGKTILCIDDKRRMEYEMKTLKMYAKLNEEREIVMKRIEESGSIYEK